MLTEYDRVASRLQNLTLKQSRLPHDVSLSLSQCIQMRRRSFEMDVLFPVWSLFHAYLVVYKVSSLLRQGHNGIFLAGIFYVSLTLAPLPPPPLWFFANSSWSTDNFALKLVIPLPATIPHLVSKKIRTQVIIGQPWVTSEWLHVSPILTNKMGLRESPPLAQF